MGEPHDEKDDPEITTRIEGEEVRLLVHIERVDDAEPDPEDPPAMPE